MATKTIVFVHGMYMTPKCWEPWLANFGAQGYSCLAPAWPGRELSISELRKRHPDPELGRLTLPAVVDHLVQVIKALPEKPIVIGHSMGGLIVQQLLHKDIAVGGVAIDSAPPMGVMTPKWSFLRANWPHIQPFARWHRPVQMTFPHFQYAFANSLPLAEQRAAYDDLVVPESRMVPLSALLSAGKVDFKRARPPLLMIAGSSDHIIPASLNRSNFNKYRGSPNVTDFKEFPGRTHFIIGQAKWQEVADYILTWIGAHYL